MAAGLGGDQAVPGHRRSLPPEVLLSRDVPVSLRPHPHGACARVRHRRSPRALQVDAGLQRAPPDGLGCLRPARRERRHRQRRPPRGMDLREHQEYAEPAPPHGDLLRLGPRAGHLRSRVLQVGAAHLHPDVRARARLQEALHRQLVPVLPDHPRQRAGGGRPLLALRLRGAGQGDRGLVLQDQRLRGRAARLVRPPPRLARARADHAAQLDRAERGRRVRPAGGGAARREDPHLHHAAGHLVRHDLRGPGPRAPAGGRARGRSRRAGEGGRLPRGGGAGVGDRAPRRRPAEARAPAQRARGQPLHGAGDPALPRRLRAHGLWHRRHHGGAG